MKIICIGRNYAAHAAELNNPVNEDPVIFLKPETALITGRLPFFIPDFSQDVHHEIELVLRICKTGKRIEERFAHKYFDAVTVGIDFTARDLQLELKKKSLPWEISKGFDGSAAVGSFVSVNDLNPESLDFSLNINGITKQAGNSSMMIFPIRKIISYASEFFTLKIGDLIFTGTPAGVGPVKRNDVLEGFIGNQCLLKLKVK
ncbi:MAG: fumarylacetoacetate hydrolase family protein [Bacteroidia bacterium]|nr:fumarylacetoacetate hydrolase family protein [Bacteroidia bacterium]